MYKLYFTRTHYKKNNTTSYLSYYAHYEDGSASAFYKWNDQCLKDQCEMAETILNTDNVEQYQGKLLFFYTVTFS